MFYMSREMWEELADVCPDVTAKMVELFEPEARFDEVGALRSCTTFCGRRRPFLGRHIVLSLLVASLLFGSG